MAEYWKSTPNYWCKFCSQYVRDTPLERKNHESSGKHQNSIQRSLRELHKNRAREDRDKQRAKDEVARLNGLVGGGKGSASGGGRSADVVGGQDLGRAGAPPKLSAEAQWKAHAEQLAALGVELPDEMKQELTGVGGWKTISTRIVGDDSQSSGRSLVDIIKQEGESKEDVKHAVEVMNMGVHKRKAEDEEQDVRDEEAAPKKKAWGSSFKSYPGATSAGGHDDLDALLSGVTKREVEAQKDESAAKDANEVKKEDQGEEHQTPLAALPDVDTPAAPVKQEGEGCEAMPPVVFKKRKVKK